VCPSWTASAGRRRQDPVPVRPAPVVEETAELDVGPALRGHPVVHLPGDTVGITVTSVVHLKGLAWGTKLAGATDEATAAGVLAGDDSRLTPAEQAMATWARAVARDPNGTRESDVAALREAGFSDRKIFAMTVFVALRITVSTVDDALGASPDAAFPNQGTRGGAGRCRLRPPDRGG
jgi:hypothetical protein